MAGRSRHSVVVGVTVAYVLAWGLGIAVGLAAMITVGGDGGGGDDGGLVALGRLALGFVVGVLLGHVAWAVLSVRLLRPFRHPGRTAATVVVAPASVLLLMAGINEVHIPWQVWPLTAVAVPAALASWATASAAMRP